jgi:cytochrome c biogenesis protein CcmG/thiol:disulfide interchange protein DsbE
MLHADDSGRTPRARSRPVMLGLAAVLLLLGGPRQPVADAVEPALRDLGAAPDFTLEAYGGGRIRLADQLGRGPLIVDFWATWCAPCVQALPHLQTLYRRYADQGLQVLAVSQDDPRSQPKIGAFVRSRKLTFPVLLDADHRVARLFGVATVPTTFLISAAGRVVALQRGYRVGDEKILAAGVEALLAGQEPEAAP